MTEPAEPKAATDVLAAEERGPKEERSTQPLGRNGAMLMLQRSAGNRAVALGQASVPRSRVIQRDPAAADPKAPATVAPLPSPQPTALPAPPPAPSPPPSSPPPQTVVKAPPNTSPAPTGSLAPSPPKTDAAPFQPPQPPPSGPTGAHFDWDAALTNFRDPLNASRAFGEIARGGGTVGALVPGGLFVGVLGGAVADVTSFYQDFTGLPSGAKGDGFMDFLVITRNTIAVANNGLGTVTAALQQAADATTVSVIGAELAPIAASFGTVLNSVKVGLDGAQVALDVLVEVEARVDRSQSAKDPDTAKKWDSVVGGYEVNIATDLVSSGMDLIDEITAGAANMKTIKAIAMALKELGPFGKALFGYLTNVVGIYAGGVLPVNVPATPVQQVASIQRDTADTLGDVAKHEAAALLLTDLDAIKLLHDTATELMTDGFADAEKQLKVAETLSASVTGGKGMFEILKEKLGSGIKAMHQKAQEAHEMIELGGNVKDKSAAIKAGIGHAEETVGTLRIPEWHIPHKPGDGLAVEAENVAIDIADKALQVPIGAARSSVDVVRGESQQALGAAAAKADTGAAFGQTLQDVSASTIALFEKQIALMGGHLQKVTDLHSGIDAGLGVLSDVLGIDPPLSIAGLQEVWDEVGHGIDQARTAAQAYLSRPVSAPEAQGPGTGGAGAAPPPAADPQS